MSRPSTRSLPDLASTLVCKPAPRLSEAGGLATTAASMPIQCAHRANRHGSVSFKLPIFDARRGIYFDKLPSLAWRRGRLPVLGRHAMLVHRKRGRAAGEPSRASFPRAFEKEGLHKVSLHKACIDGGAFLGVFLGVTII